MHIETLVVAGGKWPAGEVSEEEAAEAVAAYARRVRDSYGRLDLEVLTPLSDQGEHPVVELREVFVPPGVRADPPPVSLPRELMKRLAEHGEPAENALPPGVESAYPEQARQAAQRPVEPVLEVLGNERNDRLVILGDPGAGKSTLARYAALTLTCGGGALPESLAGRLPVVVELRRYAQEEWREKPFEEYLDHLYDTEGMCVPRRVLAPLLASGRALVIFDGLDELFDPAIRETVAKRIAAFASRYAGTRVVVTSRVIGYRKGVLAGAGFEHYMLQDLDTDQIKEFTRCWYATACPGDPAKATALQKRVTDAVTHSRAVAELAGNPLLLTILAIIGRRQTLPRDRQGVYEHAVTVLVARWDQDTKHLAPRVSPEVREVLEVLEAGELLELLRLLARKMQDDIAGNHIHTVDLEKILHDYLKDYDLPPVQVRAATRAIVRQLRERNFILSHYGSGVYGFVHRTFLEYLAAADLTHRYTRDREWTPDQLVHDVLGELAGKPAWHEVLLLVTGQLAPPHAGRLIDHLLHLHRTRDDQRLLALAVRALAEVRKIGLLTQQSENVVSALISSLTDHVDTHLYLEEAAPALATFSDHWAGRQRLLRWSHLHGQFLSFPGWVDGSPTSQVAPLYRSPGTLELLAVHAPIAHARRAALDRLAEHWPNPATRELLTHHATQDPDENLRYVALQHLAQNWPDSTTRELLTHHALHDPEPEPRGTALQALAEHWPDSTTRELLTHHTLHDFDSKPRTTALQALAEHWPDPTTRELLTHHANNHPDPFTHHIALRGLAEHWPDSATRELLTHHANNHPDSGPRSTALSCLAEHWPDSTTRELLTHHALHDPEPEPRGTALRGLAEHWPDPTTRELLTHHANNHPDPFTRRTALAYLTGRWPDDTSRELLTDRAGHDPDLLIRRTALARLARGWPDQHTRHLLTHHVTQDPDPRVPVLQALARYWPDSTTRELLTHHANNHPDPFTRRTALAYLTRHWPDQHTRDLLTHHATHEPHPEPRLTVLRNLTRHWPDQTTRNLLTHHATRDPDEDLRLTALRMWAVAGGPEVGPVLVRRVREDASGVVRAGLAWTLAFGWYDEPEVHTLLRSVAGDDEDERVREEATAALAAAEAMRDHADHV
ncbi:HEAT repeat domain-containing protein [Streptomyces calidiresistens]